MLETKGFDPLKDVKTAAAWRWCAVVSALGDFGQWSYRVVARPEEVRAVLTDTLASKA